MRLFIAINLPATVREAMHDVTAPLRDAAPDVRWIRSDALHVTLKFLGTDADNRVAPLTAAVRRAVHSHRALPLALQGVGAFPSLRRPRVVWFGVEPVEWLDAVQAAVETACVGLGFAAGTKPFRPHVTLGRVDDAEIDTRALRSAAAAITFHTKADVASVDVMNSERGPDGSRYRVVGHAPLAVT